MALGVLRFAPDGLGPLARGTHLVKLTHVRFLLRTGAACTILAERAWSARHARRVAYAGACEPGPLATFAFTVRNAHVSLFLGLAVRRSFGPETPSATLRALCILGAITRCLRPLTLTANLVSYKQQFNIIV